MDVIEITEYQIELMATLLGHFGFAALWLAWAAVFVCRGFRR